nr:hypothetical protein [Tanacetum cinerariifolium]
MIAILEKYEHNQDFHQIVDFVGASHIRYALTFNPTVHVSHIRQFWSTARIETTEEGTKILATVDGVRPIGMKWILKNKQDERGIVIRNKARLVAQGHTQEEGIDNDEMDMKSAFLYGTIDEEVYVMQPPGFHDPEFPARVYKVEKAMYGLHQAPKAWYGTLSKYLLTNGFQREFKALMHEKFQMSTMGDILKKFGYSDVRSANTPMDKENPWGKDETGKYVDLHHYRSMIRSLMYLTASRPDIMFAICVCARHQVTPKECHMHAVKMIFRYLKGYPKLGLWYPK